MSCGWNVKLGVRCPHQACWILLLVVCCLSNGVHASNANSKVDYASLVDRLWRYKPELPKRLLDGAVGVQGDLSRLERVMWRIANGQPVKIVLMGGSISLRGWNSPDQTYIKQVHKWLEMVFLPECYEKAEKRHEGETEGGQDDGGSTEGGARRRSRRLAQRADNGGQRQRQLLSAELASTELPTGSSSGIAGALPWRLLIDQPQDSIHPAEGYAFHRGPLTSAPHHLPDRTYVTSGHVCEGSHIELVLLAVPAAGPGYAERCVLQHVPEDADLFLIDFAVNDYEAGDKLSHPERHAYERIMRHVLGLPHQPAVMLFEAYSWNQAEGTYVGYGKYGYNLAQDKHTMIAEYYGNVQVLSVRGALYQLLSGTDDPNKMIYLGTRGDLLHVTAYGHRWYSDIIINYLRGVANSLLTKALAAQALQEAQPAAAAALLAALPGAGDPSSSAPAEALQQQEGGSSASKPGDNWAGWVNATGGCAVAGSLGRDYNVKCSPSGLKPPFFRDNEADPSGVCAIGSDFEGVVKEHQGWEWVDEGSNGSHKWGFVTSEPGSRLVVHLDISGHQVAKKALSGRAGGGGSGDQRLRTRDIMAWLIYLQSWHDMGQASISCSGACSCKPATINAMIKDTNIKATTPALHAFTLSKVYQGTDGGPLPSECLVEVSLLSETTSKDHKFKVVGITTSTNPVWHLGDIVLRGDHEYVGAGSEGGEAR